MEAVKVDVTVSITPAAEFSIDSNRISGDWQSQFAENENTSERWSGLGG